MPQIYLKRVASGSLTKATVRRSNSKESCIDSKVTVVSTLQNGLQNRIRDIRRNIGNGLSGLVGTIRGVRNTYEGKMLCADPIKAVAVYEAALATTFVVPRNGCLSFRFP